MVKTFFYSCLILFVVFTSCTSKSIDDKESANNDSIKKYLELASNDTLDFELRNKYNDKAFSLIDLSKSDSLTIWNLYSVSIFNANLLRFNKLEKNSEDLYNLSVKSKNEMGLAYANKLKGLSHMYKSENLKALESFYKAKKIFLKFNATERLIRLNKDIAQVQHYSCDFFGSNKTLFQNLEFMNKSNLDTKNDLYRNYSIIAINFASLQDYKSSIEFQNKALEYADNKLDFINISYLGIADCYLKLKEFDKSIYFINKILRNANCKSLSPQTYYSAKSKFGYLKLIQNKMDGLPKIFYDVEDYYSKNDDVGGQNTNQIFISRYYMKICDTANAIKFASKALRLSKTYRNPSEILLSLDQVIKVDKRNASTKAQEYIRIADSLNTAERNFRDKFARIEFETNEIIQEKEIAIRQKWIIVTVSGIIIIIITLLLIITRQRSKQKGLNFLQSQQQSNEEIYDLMLSQKSKEELAKQEEKKRIALELHDGVMNRLSSVRLNLNIFSQRINEKTIENCINQISEIHQIEKEIRQIAHDLNFEVFSSNNSFAELLGDFISTQNSFKKTNYVLEADKTIDWNHISSSIKMNLFRIIQEASQNINKFSGAKNAIISILFDDNNLCLSITDDGFGFNVETTSEGIGLKNIRHRVEILKGKFVIQSIKNKSTSLNIAIPLL